jgi:hypothetical protein
MSTRTPSPTIARARGRIGGLVRDRDSNDPELIDAYRDLASAKLEQYIQRVISEAPPLTPEQRDRIASLLRGGAAA